MREALGGWRNVSPIRTNKVEMALVLMVVAPERFRDEELFDTQAELTQAGHQIVIASTRSGLCPGSRGGHVTATLTLAQVQCHDYAAVVFVGGGGAKLLFHNIDAWRIAREMAQNDKIVAGICLAPVILAYAGVLNGRQATVAGTEAATMTAHGAHYTGPGVTVDGHFVTANGPKSSRLFGQKIVQLLAVRAAA